MKMPFRAALVPIALLVATIALPAQAAEAVGRPVPTPPAATNVVVLDTDPLAESTATAVCSDTPPGRSPGPRVRILMPAPVGFLQTVLRVGDRRCQAQVWPGLARGA